MTLPIDRELLPVDLPAGSGRLVFGPTPEGYSYVAYADDRVRTDEETEPRPFEPGDTVSVFPVTVPGGPSGYIVFRPDDPPGETMSEPLSDPYADEPGPYRTAIPGQPLPAAVEEGDVVEAVWVLDDGTTTEIGPVERALRADIGRLVVRGHLAGTLVASATALAQAMDRAPADKIAGIGRELREHIKRIEEEAGDDEDTTDHRSSLSTPI